VIIMKPCKDICEIIEQVEKPKEDNHSTMFYDIHPDLQEWLDSDFTLDNEHNFIIDEEEDVNNDRSI